MPSQHDAVNILAHDMIESSGVLFQPSKQRGIWKIGGKWYDLNPFLDRHPGGRQILELSRDRFEDSTYAFESFHTDQPYVRKILEKYRVDGPALPTNTAGGDIEGSSSEESSDTASDAFLTCCNSKERGIRRRRRLNRSRLQKASPSSDEEVGGPLLSDLNGFYGELRAEVHDYLEKNGGKGPTVVCVILYASSLFAWLALHMFVLYTGCQSWGMFGFFIFFMHVLAAGILGGFGHNWVHQVKYRTWATFSLDLIGFSSENWFREHLLQHHLYTNTDLDNHFRGTEPFLAADPSAKRTFLHKLSTVCFPVVLSFGVLANWVTVLTGVLKGLETWRWSMCTQVLLTIAYVVRFGFSLEALYNAAVSAGMSIWYFTIAIMNHNTDHTLVASTQSRDWAEQQLKNCSDIGVGLGFLPSWRYLWLNYHTVHHLFPTVDMSKHPAIQEILIRAAQKHKVKYHCPTFFEALTETVINMWRPIRLVSMKNEKN